MELAFNVSKQHIERADSEIPVAGSKNYLTAKFNFLTDEWTGTKTAIFKKGSDVLCVVLDEDDTCLVPWEVIKPGIFLVSVFCGDLVTTNQVKVNVDSSGYAVGKTPNLPTPDVYSQIITSMDDMKEDIEELKQSGGGSSNINPVAKTDEMTEPVGVDANGALFTKPSSGGSADLSTLDLSLSGTTLKVSNNGTPQGLGITIPTASQEDINAGINEYFNANPVSIPNIPLTKTMNPNTNYRSRVPVPTVSSYCYGKRIRLKKIGVIREIEILCGIQGNTTLHCTLYKDDLTTIMATTSKSVIAGANQFISFIFNDIVIPEDFYYIEVRDELKGLSKDLITGNTDMSGATTSNPNYYANNGTGATGYWTSGGTNYGNIVNVYTPDDYVLNTGIGNKKMMIIGDSLSDSFSTESVAQADIKWHKILGDRYNVKIYDQSYGGTGWITQSASGYNKDFVYNLANNIYAQDCDATIVMGSVNDMVGLNTGAFTIGAITDTTSSTGATYYSRIKYFMETFISTYPTRKLGIVTMPPTVQYNPTSDTGNINTQMCNNMISALGNVCKLYGIKFKNLYEESGLYPFSSIFKSTVYIDDTHVNNKGQDIIASALDKFFVSLL